MKRQLRLSPLASITPFLEGGTLVAFSVGPEGSVYLVVALNTLDYRTGRTDGASFPTTVPESTQKYRVVVLSGSDVVLDLIVSQEPFDIHDIQPLNDELLLVCSRSRHMGPTKIEKNGRVYSRDGQFRRAILLGDGIQSVQVAPTGVIWTSFFDEGIFGNFGWDDPLGASGLVAWDGAGKKLYEFEPAGTLDAMADCYALNVQSDDDVWCYYYTDFPLVHLHQRQIASVWETPVSGSDAFAVWKNHALFRGGYKDRDTYRLVSLVSDGEARLLSEIELCSENGVKLTSERAIGRAHNIYFLSNQQLYKVDVREAIAAHEG